MKLALTEHEQVERACILIEGLAQQIIEEPEKAQFSQSRANQILRTIQMLRQQLENEERVSE